VENRRATRRATAVVRVGLAAMCAAVAALLLAGSDPSEAEKALEHASGRERVELLLKLAEANMYRAPDKVIAYAQQAVGAATALGLERESARALLARGTGFFQRGDLDHALENYQEGLAISERLPDHLINGACLNGVAAVNLKRGRIEAALDFFGKAIEELKQIPAGTKLAGAYNNVALIYYSKGQYNQALDFMFKALRLYETEGDANGQGVALNAIGNVYNKLADPARARANFEQALQIAESNGNKQLIVGCLVNIGEIHGRNREWDLALGDLSRALPIARELGSKDSISVCLNNIGDMLREKGESAQALGYYLESLKIFEEMHARPRQAVSFLNIGRLYLKTGDLAQAERFLLKAYELARDVEERGLQKDAAQVLGEFYRKQGNYRRAFEFARTYSELNEQIFSKENYEKIATLQAGYESEKQGREIELLKRQREIQELQVKRQRLWLVLIATGLVLLAGLAFVLFRRYRLKARTNAELAEAYGRMSQLAQHDELTGLYNRRSATARIEIETVRMSRTHSPFSILLLDVDDFKRINDENGHECGDAVLRHLADLLRSRVRVSDVVARWGGEEFLVILPDTDREGAAVLAEQVRQGVASSHLDFASRDVSFTVTVGVNVYDRLGLASDFLRGADEALYEGKRAGKNRVVCAPAAPAPL
jgi:two-component system, cell cycle response regulator